ncbi:cyclin-like protein [Rhodofomes roseus]|uniref:Cyclin-like protein n=1 Tax=Rhodofomes roseus TaxID=34475 RepID=A0ABQ8KAE9_9APHY|nr:cyclin-like protein [Rhodofomes roseus]KAH9834019.1 cyclin-like protein [Rhodofomes roseus]
MAAVSGPSTARHPSPFRRANKISSRPPPAPSSGSSGHSAHHGIPDPYYGHEETAKLCGRFVTHLFACPDLPPLSTANPPAPSPPLALFIAYALHRTRLHTSVTFAALYLLQRLKARFPAARGSSGHRLFISAFMIASKVICDDTYSNKSWSIVGQGMFALREVNQMEREMCSYLEWQLNIEPGALKEFEAKVRRDFKGQGPYPTYVLPTPAPTPVPSTTPYGATSTATPSFAARPSTSPPKPTPMPVDTPPAYPSPPTSPDTPDTPEQSYSTSTSPASSASPSTPPGFVDANIRIASHSTHGTPHAIEQDSVAAVVPPPLRKQTSKSLSRSNTLESIPTKESPSISTTSTDHSSTAKKAKGQDWYAHAVPCVW